jgi:hypothetical protein
MIEVITRSVLHNIDGNRSIGRIRTAAMGTPVNLEEPKLWFRMFENTNQGFTDEVDHVDGGGAVVASMPRSAPPGSRRIP